jgi:hypothetical protein
MIQEQKANTYMTRLRVLSDVGQTLPNGNYVRANKPTVIKVFGFEVPAVYEQYRTEQERQWLTAAKVEHDKRLDKELAEYPTENDKKQVRETWPHSPQSVFHLFHPDDVLHPLLKIEQEFKCKCGELYYAEKKANQCPKCQKPGEVEHLPPPKQIEQYNSNQELVKTIMGEILPQMQAMQVESIKAIVDTVMEAVTAPASNAGGKTGKKG